MEIPECRAELLRHHAQDVDRQPVNDWRLAMEKSEEIKSVEWRDDAEMPPCRGVSKEVGDDPCYTASKKSVILASVIFQSRVNE